MSKHTSNQASLSRDVDVSVSIANRVVSPCVSICALDENDICVGCQRSGAEITVWSSCSEEEKKAIMVKVREREKSSYI